MSKSIFRYRISHYATAQVSDSAFIIGGVTTKETVARFKDGRWGRMPDLKQGRYGHGAISIGDSQIMVIGGMTNTE